MKSVYIHIPFCDHICTYCDFCKFIYNEKWVHVYLNALENEIKDRYMDEEINTIYIGGGTPSCLNINELNKLMEIIKIFKTNYLEEFTFECNINDINEKMLDILKDNGVNRLSIGIESFNKNKLNFMERNIDFKTALTKINLCRKKEFNNINVDLMYAIPGEKLNALKKDIKYILKLKPNHISTYSLEINEHTKLAINNTEYIDDELDYNMFCTIEKKLKKYHHYEISNYALPGYESKHNMVYWNNREYYGFGLGASGYSDDVRYTNTKNLKKYLLGEYVFEKELVTYSAKMNYEIMLGLRKYEGISIEEFKKKYNVNIEDAFNLKELLKNRDLIKKNGYIYVNPKKMYVMNEILLKII